LLVLLVMIRSPENLVMVDAAIPLDSA
jgi:hypothetical protein